MNPVVREWIARAERHWRMAELLPDLPPGYLSGLFQVQRSLETYLRAALIAQDVPSRKCRDLQRLSDRLRDPIPGWQPDPATLNLLTQAALAYLDPGEHPFEPSQDVAWALAEAEPLRDSLRRWFAGLEEQPQAAATQETACSSDRATSGKAARIARSSVTNGTPSCCAAATNSQS